MLAAPAPSWPKHPWPPVQTPSGPSPVLVRLPLTERPWEAEHLPPPLQPPSLRLTHTWPQVDFEKCFPLLSLGIVTGSSGGRFLFPKCELSGASSPGVTASAAQVRELPRNQQHLPPRKVGLGQRLGACLSWNLPALLTQGNELVASVHWWVAMQVASSPGIHLSFRASVTLVCGTE